MRIRDLFEEQWTTEFVIEWLMNHHDDGFADPQFTGNVTVENGVVAVNADVHLKMDGKSLPFKFADVHNHWFSMTDPGSLKGCPKVVKSAFALYGDKEISFEGAPQEVGGHQHGSDFGLTLDLPSLKDVHKHIKTVNGSRTVYFTNMLKKNALGVLLINGVLHINASSSSHDSESAGIGAEQLMVREILKKHLGKGRKGVIEAQREMLEYDPDNKTSINLEPFAQL